MFITTATAMLRAQAEHIYCSAQVNSASCYSFGWGKDENVTSAGWQVTVYDPV